MKKSRFLYLHEATNSAKLKALDNLQAAYTTYLQECVDRLLKEHRFSVLMSEKRNFFPASNLLSNQIVKNVQDHAIAIVRGWTASRCTNKLKSYINKAFKEGSISEADRLPLYTIGKKSLNKPSDKILQSHLDLYWNWLLDLEVTGHLPTISYRCGMRLSEMTATLGTSSTTKLATWWLGFSHLEKNRARIQLPLRSTPYLKCASEASKGILARRDKQGRWRFEVVEKKDWHIPAVVEDAPRVGIDVGLNVIAATSDGRLFGDSFKAHFDTLHKRVKELRSNRFRQGLHKNSPKLDRLEARLSGWVKTVTGTIAALLATAYAGHTFIIEDLDLCGCKGQKRFAYKALHKALAWRVPVKVVNPAYTSQTCPSCGYRSRKNRNGIEFECRSCGRISHADVVGAVNLLRRSQDEQIDLNDDPFEVQRILDERWQKQRNSSPRTVVTNAPRPSGQRFTTLKLNAQPRRKS